MSMLEVAKFLHYSKSIDHPSTDEQFLNLSMANSGRLFCCLQANRFKREPLGESRMSGFVRKD
jgi:hypothetical protein